MRGVETVADKAIAQGGDGTEAVCVAGDIDGIEAALGRGLMRQAASTLRKLSRPSICWATTPK